MDYEKKYNLALKWMRELYPGLHGATKEDAEHYFPELRESEDERIRNEIIAFIEQAIHSGGGISVPKEKEDRWLAYLEKQKEQKPRKFKLGDKVHWHDDDTNVITITGFRDDAYLTDSAYGPILFCDEDNWERIEKKPVEWSEEDERMVWFFADDYDNNLGNMPMREVIENRIKFKDWLLNRLKSIRPQPKVELSEDVKKTLDEVSHILIGLNYKQVAKDYKQAIEKLLYSRPSWKPSDEQMEALKRYSPVHHPDVHLVSLYDDLKKLM